MKEQPNLSTIKELSGGDSTFEAKLIGILKKELPEEITRYKKHLAEKKYQLAAEDVHKIKHKISILGLETSYYLATEYEDELRESNFSKKNTFENVLEVMLSYVNQLK